MCLTVEDGTRGSVMSANTYHQQRGATVPAPVGCPVRHDWSPLDDDYLADPYPVARQFGDEWPIFYAARLGYVVVNRMEDIVAVFTDPDTYASINVQDPIFPLSDEGAAILGTPDFDPVAVMSNRPEPDHGRIRAITREGFSNRRLKLLEPFITRRSHDLLDAMLAGDQPADFIRAFAFPLPGETVFRLLGFPAGDDEKLKQWCGDRKAFSWGQPSPEQQREIAEHMVAYWRYCREFTASKVEHPTDDFTSELVAAHREHPDQITYREVESVVYALSFAGHEAVTALLGNCLLCLLPRRDQWDEIFADPTLIDNAVEEVLRYESSQVSWRRVTTRPVTLGGIDLAEGTPLLLNFAAANRQPDVFGDAETFDIHRPNAGRHISFGKGIHYCLGANLAKLEARIMLDVVSQRIPSLRLSQNQDIRHFPNITFRGPERLLVEWEVSNQHEAH
jgi:cytochrome P450